MIQCKPSRPSNPIKMVCAIWASKTVAIQKLAWMTIRCILFYQVKFEDPTLKGTALDMP